MLIIPAIDIYEGKCVRLRQGDYNQQTVYSESPVDIARQFSDAGLQFLHIIDLQGAKERKIINLDSIRSILSLPNIQIEVGGGLRTSDDILRLLDLGAKRVIIGSVAAKSPELAEYWIQQFGNERVVIGMDVKNDSVAISGWLEDSKRDPIFFLRDMVKRGATIFICTDISRDGMLKGPNINFYQSITSSFPSVEILASGGISQESDLTSLDAIHVSGVIIGKAIYEGNITLEQLAALKK